KDSQLYATTVNLTSYADANVVGGTSYSYMVKAFDAANNISLASNTAAITVPMATLQITGVNVSNKTKNTAVINWTTNLPSMGYVQYGTSANNMLLSSSYSTLGTSQSVTLGALQPR